MFSYVLPYIMRRLSRWSGALTRGQLDKAVIRQLFIFQLVSNFIVFSLLGVVYETYLTISEDIGKESWSTIYAGLGDVPAKVTQAYISESLYWLSWYPSVIFPDYKEYHAHAYFKDSLSSGVLTAPPNTKTHFKDASVTDDQNTS